MRRRPTIFDEFERMQDEMNRMFNNVWGGNRSGMPLLGDANTPTTMEEGMRYPTSDLWEDDNNVYTEIEMPGLSKDDIKINVDDNRLEIKAEKSDEDTQEDKKKGFYRLERQYSGFYRSFTLPENADTQNADAEYKDGVLKITVPKKQVDESKRKMIDVK